ncbi:hypothetical protein [Bradyrhizobium sp. CCGUVB23]|uniref:hypothetical protein n=1 Tax=Bradyrhizobium sp. CCGUVB23 TaxID=2949630 RepID=UPI0020B1CAF9|nr:hypothetical protein [Bradyrhizobium sp. CCGUVB23]MCP3466005.1 hypothetical protein [Bradyrhizobium sp. CCGUVB23]
MRTTIRIVISVLAGFLLMIPLGYVYGLLSWPTFHSWGLLHGGFFAAWPTLSILAYLMLGYLPFFTRVDNTPLLIVGLFWGLLLASFLGIGSYLNAATIYGLLAGTTVLVAALSFFARLGPGFALLAIAPVLFSKLDLLLDLMSSPPLADVLDNAYYAFRNIRRPLIATLAGWGLGSLARSRLSRSPSAE